MNRPIHRHRHISVEDVEAILDTPTYTYMGSDYTLEICHSGLKILHHIYLKNTICGGCGGLLYTPIHRHRHISVEDVEAILDTPTYTYMDSDYTLE